MTKGPRPQRWGADREAGHSRARGCTARARCTQYESELRISLWLRVPMAHHVWTAMLSLMKRTVPSQKATLTPPGWPLVAVMMSLSPPGGPPHELAATQDRPLGVFQWL